MYGGATWMRPSVVATTSAACGTIGPRSTPCGDAFTSSSVSPSGTSP